MPCSHRLIYNSIIMSLNIRYSEVIVFVVQEDPDLPTGSEAWHYQWLSGFASIQNAKVLFSSGSLGRD